MSLRLLILDAYDPAGRRALARRRALGLEDLGLPELVGIQGLDLVGVVAHGRTLARPRAATKFLANRGPTGYCGSGSVEVHSVSGPVSPLQPATPFPRAGGPVTRIGDRLRSSGSASNRLPPMSST